MLGQCPRADEPSRVVKQEQFKSTVPWMPGAILNLESWVRKLASTSTYAERSWRNLARGRWEAKNHGRPAWGRGGSEAVEREEKKRVSPSDIPKPKKSKARKSKNDTAALPANVAQKLRDEEEEKEDVDYELVARKRVSVEASKATKPVTVEEAHLRTEEISEDGCDAREAFSKSRAELKRCEDDLKRLTEERDALKLLYVQKEEEVRDLRAELAITHKGQTNLIEQVQQKAEKIEQLREEAEMKEAETLGWKQSMDRLASEKDTARAQLSSTERQIQSMKEESLARAKKIEELKTRLAADLAKAASEAKRVKADAEAIVAVYHAVAKGANARAKEISDAAHVRLSCVAEHTKCQSRRKTLEEIHARDFDLMADIENAKGLEAEAEALLSDDDDSGSATGYESGEDKDEAPGED
ncbi:PREDICTED: microtubule-associated protein futsch-like [Nicotiana attenuata]|uniref:microtubule-associated protein futsch-like n=1 Tax=Nicotiana attenuata TaxID=49451 RepID=UPI00090482F8|nr:PREDICTED: microtubule-associated protein futsch-like [Nicotiana attenuata]